MDGWISSPFILYYTKRKGGSEVHRMMIVDEIGICGDIVSRVLWSV